MRNLTLKLTGYVYNFINGNICQFIIDNAILAYRDANNDIVFVEENNKTKKQAFAMSFLKSSL